MIQTTKAAKKLTEKKFDLVAWLKRVWKSETSEYKLLILLASLEEIKPTIMNGEYTEVKTAISEKLQSLGFIRQEVNAIFGA